jgi:hypothetical protein
MKSQIDCLKSAPFPIDYRLKIDHRDNTSVENILKLLTTQSRSFSFYVAAKMATAHWNPIQIGSASIVM